VQSFWNRIRKILLLNLSSVTTTSTTTEEGLFDNERANSLLQKYVVVVDDVMPVFDMLFDIE
jgi:hypothetical protein